MPSEEDGLVTLNMSVSKDAIQIAEEAGLELKTMTEEDGTVVSYYEFPLSWAPYGTDAAGAATDRYS